ncbi:MAG TPA: ABC transporter permease [Chloroflexota bacterium]|jgi:peptide/nickel transport system permease protein
MSSTTLPRTGSLNPLASLRGVLRPVVVFFQENRLFTAGVLLLLALLVFGLIGMLFANPKGSDMGAVPLNLSPSAQHPLGTDGLGRDMFAVMVISIPSTFKIGFVAGAVGVAIGATIGLFSGYYRGAADTIFSSFADVMLVIPALAILITVSAYVRVVTVELMALIVGLLSWPLAARVIRSQTLSLRERLFVQVAKLSGESDFEIITRQILPNLTAYLAASFVGAVSGAILASVGLEVLGLGPQNVPTIGRSLFYAFKYAALFKGMWWWWGPPVVTLAIIFTGLFWISLSLDKYANPRLKGSARS